MKGLVSGESVLLLRWLICNTKILHSTNPRYID
ncbi:hypothetical protein P5673_004626 [Acropora cervicornis]|uniref:Uncharacterized protein n=1 Tax=Acropora cervicornis TaxID=6130 RepID=A0AAD9R0M6_ACRCE|nr:hypothetical protein P5673_004626 [Acropora cervicornis]